MRSVGKMKSLRMFKQVVDMFTIVAKRGLTEEIMTCSVAFYFQGL
jgi:hypothetical protein